MKNHKYIEMSYKKDQIELKYKIIRKSKPLQNVGLQRFPRVGVEFATFASILWTKHSMF